MHPPFVMEKSGHGMLLFIPEQILTIDKKYITGLLAAFILMYIVPLGVRPMLTPDEFRYGEIPREMIATGDWVVPHLNGLRYFEKPALGYWLNAASLLVFGENAFAVRFSSALSIGLSALLVWFLVRKMKRDDGLGLFAAAIFMTCGLVYGIGTFATLDAMTTLFLTGSLVFFLLAQGIPKFNRAKVLYLILFGAFCGLTFLTKGFLAFVVPGLAIVSFLAWEKRWKDMILLPWIPLAAALLVILPWAFAVHQREPDFWHYFIIEEHWNRFFGKSEGQHHEPFWYFIPVLAAGWLPWLLLVPAALYFCRDKLKGWFKEDKLFRFCLCAAVVPFIFFSLCSGKLGTYILPCFPFIAILTAYLLRDFLTATAAAKYYRIHLKTLIIVLIVGLCGFAAAQIVAEAGVYEGLYRADETAEWIMGIIGGIIAVAFLYLALRGGDWRHRAACLTAFAVPLFMLSMLAAPMRFFEGKAQGVILKKIAAQIPPDATVIAHRNIIHATCWELKRHDIYLLGSPGELDYGLKYPEAKGRFVENYARANKMIKDRTGKVAVLQRGNFREGVPAAETEFYDHELMISIY